VRKETWLGPVCLGAWLLVAAPLPAEAGRATRDTTRISSPSLCSIAERHVGRPYVWGAAGLKSFDCSGYVWRTYFENGYLVKRTTARKLYFCLPAVPDSDRYAADNLVFFDNMKHVGIVHDDSTFYHAQSSRGTNLSRFDPFWRKKVYGFRRSH
jgi:peptidoglycan DL-endopeptidase CwlO